MADPKPITRFRGLNNVQDRLEMGLAWLAQADNVQIDAQGKIDRREGYGPAVITGDVTGAYGTADHQRFYLVVDGQLLQVNADHTSTVLREGLTSAPMHWAEVNDQVFYSNGPDKGLIHTDGTVRNWAWPMPPQPDVIAIAGALTPGLYRVAFTYRLPDGRETGASDPTELQIETGQALQVRNIPQEPGCLTRVYIAPAGSEVYGLAGETTLSALVWNVGPDHLGVELAHPASFPPPALAVQPAFWGGRAWLLEWLPHLQATVLWFSAPLGFHLFDLERDFIMVPGRGLMLAAHEKGLVIGTDRGIHAWDGTALAQLADYGVVQGWPAAIDTSAEGMPLYFWTQRGVCRGLPFENLTQRRISVAPGLQVGAAIVHKDGNTAFVATLQAGGTPFNAHTQEASP